MKRKESPVVVSIPGETSDTEGMISAINTELLKTKAGKMLTPTDIASRIGASRVTIIKLCELGIISAVNISASGRRAYRISEAAYSAFLKNRTTTEVQK